MRDNFEHKVLLIILITCVFGSSFAQDIQFLPLTPLNKKELLPSLNTRRIVKDKLGYMWIASQDGVYRFDGRHATFYHNSAIDARFSLNGTDIFDLAIDQSGENIWALSNNGGLTRISIDEGIVRSTFSLPGQLWSKCLSIRHNILYIGTADGTIIQFDTRSNTIRSTIRLSQWYDHPGSVENIVNDDLGNIWLLVSGLGILTTDSSFTLRRMIPVAEIFPGKEVEFTDIARYERYAIITTAVGVVVMDMRQRKIIPNNIFFPAKALSYLSRHVDCVAIDQHTIFLSGPGLLLRVEPGVGICKEIRFSRNKEDKNWLLYTSSILYDGRSVWIGGQYGTAWIKDVNTPFTAFYDSMDSTENKLEHCMTLFHKEEGVLYVCADNGLFQLFIQTGIVKKLSGPETFYSGLVLPGNKVLTSGANGTEIYMTKGGKKRLGDEYPELAPLSSISLVSMENMDDSLYFLAAFDPKNIYCWNRVRKTLQKIEAASLGGGAKGYFVKRLFLDGRKRLWILFDASISLYDPYTGKASELPVFLPGSNEPAGINMDICEAGDRYWIAAYGKGLIEMSASGKVEKVYALKEGLHNLGLYRIFPMNDSLLMASSNEGLTVVNWKSRSVYNYFEEDGLHSNYFEQFSGDRSGDRFFFGGLKGLTMIDPKKFRFTQSLDSLFITSVSTQSALGTRDTFGTHLEKLSIPANVIQASVNFTAINYLSPDKDRFLYRIPEVDKNWISIGNQHNIPLVGISPGTYTVEISNSGEHDLSDHGIARISLVWMPHWYQTWVFKGLIGAIVALLFFALYRYRIAQMRKQQQIRKDIASDLHDDIGSTLNALKVYSHLARREPNKDEHLSRIEDSLTQATIGLRDMVWVLDDSEDTITSLLERIKKFALPLVIAHGIEMNCIVEEDSPRPIDKTEKRNLLMIAKESINNSVKYSSCKNIQLQIRHHKHQLSMIIQDDGRGFDTGVPSSGNGLKNIRQRAKQIRCTARIFSFPGGGTTIEIVNS